MERLCVVGLCHLGLASRAPRVPHCHPPSFNTTLQYLRRFATVPSLVRYTLAPSSRLSTPVIAAWPQVFRPRLLKWFAAFCVLECVGAATLPSPFALKFDADVADTVRYVFPSPSAL